MSGAGAGGGAKKGARDLSGFNYGAMSSLVVNQGKFPPRFLLVAVAVWGRIMLSVFDY